MWTGVEAIPEGPGTSQILQNLKQFSPTLDKSPQVEYSLRNSHLNWATCLGVLQQLLHDGHGEKVPTQTEGHGLEAAAQGRQNGFEVGVPDSTLL